MMLKIKLYVTRTLCVLLASLLLFLSPASKHLDTRHIDNVEASSVVIGGGIIITGVTAFYLLSNLYGYHTSNSQSYIVYNDFIDFLEYQLENGYPECKAVIDLLKISTSINMLALSDIGNTFKQQIDLYFDQKAELQSNDLDEEYYVLNSISAENLSCIDTLPQTSYTALFSEQVLNQTLLNNWNSGECENFIVVHVPNSNYESGIYYCTAWNDLYSVTEKHRSDVDSEIFVFGLDGLYLFTYCNDSFNDMYSFSLNGYAYDATDSRFELVPGLLNINSTTLSFEDSRLASNLQDDIIYIEDFVSSYVGEAYSNTKSSCNSTGTVRAATLTTYPLDVSDRLSNGYDIPSSDVKRIINSIDSVYTDLYLDDYYSNVYAPTSDDLVDVVYPTIDSVLTGAQTGEDVKPGTGTDTSVESTTKDVVDSITSGFTSLWDWLREILNAILSLPLSIWNKFVDVLNKISDYSVKIYTRLGGFTEDLALRIQIRIKDTLQSLFVPDLAAMETQLNIIQGKFSWITSLFNDLKSLLNGFKSGQAPVIYIDFSKAASSKYIPVGKLVALDFSWYAKYKPTGDAILGAFMWIVYLWRLFKKLPSVINGAGMSSSDNSSNE